VKLNNRLAVKASFRVVDNSEQNILLLLTGADRDTPHVVF
jgi:hypothetical protein